MSEQQTYIREADRDTWKLWDFDVWEYPSDDPNEAYYQVNNRLNIDTTTFNVKKGQFPTEEQILEYLQMTEDDVYISFDGDGTIYIDDSETGCPICQLECEIFDF